MNAGELIAKLKKNEELVPGLYEGSYELENAIISHYAKMPSLAPVTFRDLNAVYMMAIGTWKASVEKKKEYVSRTCLPDPDKAQMYATLDRVWDKACRREYEHWSEGKDGKPTIGMFGTGFYSFEKNTADDDARRFISMCVEILPLNDDEEIFRIADKTLSKGIPGMKAASASVILHCLKPMVFPIINSNYIWGTVYEYLGISLNNPTELKNYIGNARIIKEFRDANFNFKNYRILDLAARDIEKDEEWIPKDYDPGISEDEWRAMVQNPEIFTDSARQLMKYILECGGQASCKELSSKYGNTSDYYRNNGTWLAKHVSKKTQCPLYVADDGAKQYWPVIFTGRDGDDGDFIWKIRKELEDALRKTDLSNITSENGEQLMRNDTAKNTILYGPPGTGKTYSMAKYAVAIIEDVPVSALEKEPYDAVIAKYNKYKEQGLIKFTTFHQSYGYEEFIEGIRPFLGETSGEIGYKCEDGIFKSFCKDAVIPAEYGTDHNAKIWKVVLNSGDPVPANSVKAACFNSGKIMYDWQTQKEHEGTYEYNKIAHFRDDMNTGDLIVSYAGESRKIDAIGVVTGDAFYDETKVSYRWSRTVNWIEKGTVYDLYEMNGRKDFDNDTLQELKQVSIPELLKLVPSAVKTSPRNHVFIIDEINRGNISKIFGELITLIEDTKRDGMPEAASAVLPYSKEEFSVPSNVFILGTMNTADRSIATLDTALRRRFDFVEMLPDTSLFKDLVIDGISVKSMIDTMNKRIEVLYDREHTLGHAYFMSLLKNPTLKELEAVFTKKVIPLLQEYFFDDYEKIRLVLNDNNKEPQYRFISVCNDDYHSLFGNTEYDFDDAVRYELNQDAFGYGESYRKIY